MANNTYYLKGEGSMNWAIFHKVSEDTMEVVALLGWTSQIDKRMPIAEARAVWKDLVSRGWRQHASSECKETTYSLRLHIYG